jgi:hypothetical protein
MLVAFAERFLPSCRRRGVTLFEQKTLSFSIARRYAIEGDWAKRDASESHSRAQVGRGAMTRGCDGPVGERMLVAPATQQPTSRRFAAHTK